jgi:hypothetical protein
MTQIETETISSVTPSEFNFSMKRERLESPGQTLETELKLLMLRERVKDLLLVFFR